MHYTKSFFTAFILSLILIPTITSAQVSLVKDTYPGTADASPSSMLVFKGKMYFNAHNRLWVTDGTTNNTQSFEDVVLDQYTKFYPSDNRFFFFANKSLWVSDGTKVSTKKLVDGLSFIINVQTVMQDNFFFLNNDNDLWVSDGTEAGTKLLKTINTASSGEAFSALTVNNLVFFSANDGTHGKELWVTDGTTAGTKMLKDIQPGSASGLATEAFRGSFNNQLIFAADDGTNGLELWISDGTTAGTKMLKDINTNAGESGLPLTFSSLVTLNGKFYFTAGDATNGQELWVSDGTTAGTQLLKDINTGINSAHPRNYFLKGNQFFFSANSDKGFELWVSDGTTVGTKLVKDIHSTSSSHPEAFKTINNQVFFRADDGVHGIEQWVTDGTEAGTKMLKDINVGSQTSLEATYVKSYITGVGNLVAFSANNNTNGQELWVTDGSEAGTKLLKDIFAGSLSSSPTELITYNGKAYFAAKSQLHGIELWTTDGTEAGTKMLKDLNTNPADAPTSTVAKLGSKLYFAAIDGTHGQELWVSDGTETGTKMLKDINTGASSSLGRFSQLIVSNNLLFFAPRTSTNGQELWVTDGTEAGTKMLKDINAGNSDSSPEGFVALQNKVYFIADDGVHGRELWVSDGTEAGTKLVKDINAGASISSLQDFMLNQVSITWGNQLYFIADDGIHGRELWVTDGTEAGTKMLKDINVGSGSSLPLNVLYAKVWKNQLFFMASNGSSGRELWVTDGTTAGTKMLKDIVSGSAGSDDFPEFTEFDNKLYFVIQTTLWATDGTEAGTSLVFSDEQNTSLNNLHDVHVWNKQMYFYAKDAMWKWEGGEQAPRIIQEFGAGYDSRVIYIANDRMYLSASADDLGVELWETNGTIAGTRRVKDIYQGLGGSNPTYLNEINGVLYFVARNAVDGHVLYKYTPEAFPAVSAPTITDFNPKMGGYDTEVTITGANFGAKNVYNVVKFNGTKAEVLSSNNNELKVKVLTGTTTGKITIEVDEQLVTSQEDFTILEVTGLPQKLAKGKLVTFPNPLQNVLQIQVLGTSVAQMGVWIYNLQGQLMLASQPSIVNGSIKVNTSNLTSGTYLIKVKVDNAWVLRRIVKQ